VGARDHVGEVARRSDGDPDVEAESEAQAVGCDDVARVGDGDQNQLGPDESQRQRLVAPREALRQELGRPGIHLLV
jgi:hypothetical protein